LTSTPAKRILIVEDNALNLELATEVLGAHGYTVLQARTAEEGLQLARSDRPDLILLDVRLPGMDGLAAVRALKQDARTSAIPAVAMAAQAMTGDEAEARLAGFDAYVTKPIDTRTLPRLVTRLLGTRERA
jgi:two-component system, cell cycle response regulator DivK